MKNEEKYNLLGQHRKDMEKMQSDFDKVFYFGMGFLSIIVLIAVIQIIEIWIKNLCAC